MRKPSLPKKTIQRIHVCTVIAATVKEITLAKLCHAPCLGLRFGETTNAANQAQLIACVRFPEKDRVKIVVHYLFCLSIRIDTTAFGVFSKVDDYFCKGFVVQRPFG